ncbi:maturation protein [ssRNA phage SRR6960799_37]|uniref:Maturation protein n=1 Tax=ssRNA phage SRR6960799_37 TaxID=2786595 RepID=A0A8S5L038_9VIRU|nr:maturation protein [ssRNA phage SRR6960799_37]DAD50693.1 TPA_asm: maturation protein [ssRNA phage SRR6960799_37]
MVVRVRSQSFAAAVGSRYNDFNGTTAYDSLASDISTCTDTVGNYPNDNALTIERTLRYAKGSVSGHRPGGIYTFSDYATGSQQFPAHLSLPTLPNDTIVSTDAVAKHNPSRAIPSLPVFLGELATLPFRLFESGLRQSVDGFHPRRRKRPGGSVVEFNFGWEPLFKDLIDMIKFQEHVNNRVKELTSLHSKGGLKRSTKKRARTDIASSLSGTLTIHSTEGTVQAYNSTTTKRKQWVSTRWKPDVAELNAVPDATELARRARLAVHGWNLSPADAWELVPWSWFADYFFNIGDFLYATRNSVGGHCESICIMEHTRTEQRHSITAKPAYFSVVPATTVRETKRRRVSAGIGLSAYSTPLIGTKQLLNLASISLSHSGLKGD